MVKNPKPTQPLNFISHYRAAMDRFAADRRITAMHLALYQGLFYFWNLNRFPASFPIARDDVMKYARIGSANTYTRLIKELDTWGYLAYRPTTDPRYRTEVCLYRFDKGIDNGPDKGVDKGVDNGPDKGPDKGVVQPLLIGIINDINEVNDINALNDDTPASKNSMDMDTGNQRNPHEHEHKKNDGRGGGLPGSLEAVQAYFAEQKFSLREAEKFYNYFGSIGWTVGKAQRPMRDWRLAANNWMLKVNPNDHENQVKPGDLRVPKDRDYQQPL